MLERAFHLNNSDNYEDENVYVIVICAEKHAHAYIRISFCHTRARTHTQTHKRARKHARTYIRKNPAAGIFTGVNKEKGKVEKMKKANKRNI